MVNIQTTFLPCGRFIAAEASNDFTGVKSRRRSNHVFIFSRTVTAAAAAQALGRPAAVQLVPVKIVALSLVHITWTELEFWTRAKQLNVHIARTGVRELCDQLRCVCMQPISTKKVDVMHKCKCKWKCKCKKRFMFFLFWSRFLRFFIFQTFLFRKTLAKFRAASRLTRSTFKITATK